MKKLSHNLVSLLGGLVIAKYLMPPLTISYFASIVAIAIMFFLGSINDTLDFTVFAFLDHRNFWTHSLLSPVVWILPFFTYYLFSIVYPPLNLLLGVCMAWAILAHLILDAFNPSGVFLTPGKKMSGIVKSDNALVNFGISAASVILIVGVI
jgi:hypothetical protein